METKMWQIGDFKFLFHSRVYVTIEFHIERGHMLNLAPIPGKDLKFVMDQKCPAITPNDCDAVRPLYDNKKKSEKVPT